MPRGSNAKKVQALADRRFEDADDFFDDYFEPIRVKEGLSKGRVESYSQIWNDFTVLVERRFFAITLVLAVSAEISHGLDRFIRPDTLGSTTTAPSPRTPRTCRHLYPLAQHQAPVPTCRGGGDWRRGGAQEAAAH
jgi:hypothetical protein